MYEKYNNIRNYYYIIKSKSSRINNKKKASKNTDSRLHWRPVTLCKRNSGTFAFL